MPTMRATESVAAAGTFQPFSGQQYEYAPWNARVQIALIAQATGLLSTVYTGSDVLQQSAPVTNKGASGVIINPDDFLLDDVVMAGDRINAIISNPTAGAITAEAVAILTPL